MLAKRLICVVALLGFSGMMAPQANAVTYSPTADEDCFGSIGANRQGDSPSTASDMSELERGILAALPGRHRHPEARRLPDR